MTPATSRQGAFKGLTNNYAIATNSVDDIYGQLIVTPKGTIWLLPAFENNADVLSVAIKNVSLIPKIVDDCFGQTTPSEKEKGIRDIFVSHASEDKDFARPLVKQLIDLPPLKWSSLKYVLTMEDKINGEEAAYG